MQQGDCTVEGLLGSFVAAPEGFEMWLKHLAPRPSLTGPDAAVTSFGLTLNPSLSSSTSLTAEGVV